MIDLQGWQGQSKFRGIGRYSKSFALALAQMRGDHEILVAVNANYPEALREAKAVFGGILPDNAIKAWASPSPAHFRSPSNERRRNLAEIARECFLASLEPDFVVVTSLFEGLNDFGVTSIGRVSDLPTAVIHYDLIPLIMKNEYHGSKKEVEFNKQKIFYLKKAKLIFAISSFVKDNTIELLNVDSEKIVCISSAADEIFSANALDKVSANKIVSRLGIDRPFLVYPGAMDPRKNVGRLLQAFRLAKQRLKDECSLILVGVASETIRAEIAAEAARLDLDATDVIIRGIVSDDELLAMYVSARAMIFQSLHEGFGLPVLEAMSCGCPVVASKTSSIPEILDYPDAMFDPLNTEEISESIARVLTDEVFRNKISRHGIKQAKKFDWKKTARTALEALENQYEERDRKFDFRKIISNTQRLIQEKEKLWVANVLSLNIRTPETKLKLLIDISSLSISEKTTGIQRAVVSLINEIHKIIDHQFEIRLVFFDEKRKDFFYATDHESRFFPERAPEASTSVDAWDGDIFLGLDLDFRSSGWAWDVLNEWHSRGIRIWHVVYDILPIEHPNYFKYSLSSKFIIWLNKIMSYDGVICISKSVSNSVVQINNSDVQKNHKWKTEVKWFHLGSGLGSSLPSQGIPDGGEEILDSVNSRLSFLSVATIEPRKGHRQMLDAFEQLWDAGHDLNLILFGTLGWKVDDLASRIRRHRRFGQNLIWIDNGSDEYLAQVYSRVNCLIAASEGEGFGLPIVEAGAYGVPVIARDIPVFREVAGVGAHYFSGLDGDALARSILQWVELYRSNRHPKPEAIERITWRESAAQLLKAINPELVGKANHREIQ